MNFFHYYQQTQFAGDEGDDSTDSSKNFFLQPSTASDLIASSSYSAEDREETRTSKKEKKSGSVKVVSVSSYRQEESPSYSDKRSSEVILTSERHISTVPSPKVTSVNRSTKHTLQQTSSTEKLLSSTNCDNSYSDQPYPEMEDDFGASYDGGPGPISSGVLQSNSSMTGEPSTENTLKRQEKTEPTMNFPKEQVSAQLIIMFCYFLLCNIQNTSITVYTSAYHV